MLAAGIAAQIGGCWPRSPLPCPDADFNGPAELPDSLTEAWPGSEEFVL